MPAPVKLGCPDCGPSPASHHLSWWGNVIDWVLTPYTRILDRLWKRLKPHIVKLPWDNIAWWAIHLGHRLGVGTIVTELRDDHSLRTRAVWEEATRRGIQLFEFRPFNQTVEWLFATYQGQRFVFEGLPRPRGVESPGLAWMDDKGVMRDKFTAASIPVARGGTAVLVKRALELFDEIGGRVIVKPRLGSRSRHTFTNITTRSELVQAFYSAQRLCPWVVIEQHLDGPVHRATVIAGKLIGVARRDVPQVTGDGAKTVGELVQIENQHPGRRGSIYGPLPGPVEAETFLRAQQLNWDSVPEAGRVVSLDWKVNRGSGGVTTEVTSEVHPENVRLFEHVAATVGDNIIGIDFIAPRLDVPWTELPACGVIECNSLPFVDLHHYPLRGTPRNAAGAIWDLVWPLERRSGSE